ncbi:hypothetical protein HGRIS_000238 [Hohenbuehelia grisea]|uniref:Uncharacterized protein n=1 Tax=Hohenbuehelia grisea TaxID=104357 RepID=A0ABR3JSA2_9AGAR
MLPTVAATWATLAIFLLFLSPAAAQAPPSTPADGNRTRDDIVCRPFGPCEACPEDSLNEPFCQPFGNRRLMHCINMTAAFPTKPAVRPGVPPPPSNASESPPQGETPAWEACGRIVSQERADFWEFVGCNLLFAAIALFWLLARSRRMQTAQARQLAARIGLTRT